MQDVYGVTLKQKNGIYENVDFLLTDKKKVEVIKKIQNENDEMNKIIYFGDGLTDEFAFEYVHSIGGKSVFVMSNEKSITNYKKLNEKGIIDECFEADFRTDSKISNYIQKQILLEKSI